MSRGATYWRKVGGVAYNGAMDAIETISIDVYPWAVPTAEQRAWFDALPADAKRKLILEAIEEGFNSPDSGQSIDEIIMEFRSDLPHAS